MSYRTNRRTGGVFRTGDEDITGARYQGRFTCPTCAAMFGPDVDPQTAELHAKEVGREIAGTNLSTFPTRAELNAHIKMIHGSRVASQHPTKQHRALGRIAPPAKESQETESTEGIMTEGQQTASDEGGILGGDEDEDNEIVGDVDDSGDILGEESEKESVFSGDEDIF